MAENQEQTAAPQQTDVEFLKEVQDQLKTLRTMLEQRFENSFTMQFIKQQMQQAESAIEQQLRNYKITAEMDAKRAEGLIK